MVELVTDIETKKKAEALQQLLDQVTEEECIPWSLQFKKACMLHPTKNEDGEIEDISALDAFLHFFSIGWKLLFSLCPPAHMLGGWACFFVSLLFIGMVTAIVG